MVAPASMARKKRTYQKKLNQKKRRRLVRQRLLEEEEEQARQRADHDVDGPSGSLQSFAKLLKAQQSHQNEQQTEEIAMTNSAAFKKDDPTALIIRNLPFTATPSDLMQCLRSHLGSRASQIIKAIEFQYNAINNRFTGEAIVGLSNQAVKDEVAALGDQEELRLSGRTLRVRRFRDSQVQMVLRKIAEDKERQFELKAFRVGARPMMVTGKVLDQVFYAMWETQEKPMLYIEDRYLAIEFDDHYRVEVPLLDTTVHTLGICTASPSMGPKSAVIAYRFILRRPPRLFRRSIARGSNHYDDDWIRTTEITDNGAFGQCSMLECVFSESFRSMSVRNPWYRLPAQLSQHSIHVRPVSMKKLQTILNTAARYRSELDAVFDALLLIDSMQVRPRTMKTDSGYDEVFQALPFRVRYFLDVLIADRKLWFPAPEDAKDVATSLKTAIYKHQLGVGHICDLLKDLVAIPFRASPIKILQREIDRLIEEEWKEHHDDEDENENETSDDEHDGDEDDEESEDEHDEEQDPESRESCATFRVLVTPLRVCPQLPAVETTNRILRQFYHLRERFIRVTFTDENFDAFHRCRSDDIMTLRLRWIVHHGLHVAGRKYVFLAYSNSQLREQSCWFYDESPRPEDDKKHAKRVVTADEIRNQVGDLSSIQIAARYGARLGQAFSETKSTIPIPMDMVETIGDVERNGHCFSDGVGVISMDLARQVFAKLEQLEGDEIDEDSPIPSAFQIRFAGTKGVVSVWPQHHVRHLASSARKQLLLRPSMVKFPGNSDHCDFEVCSIAKPIPCYLNRQIITILSSLGIRDHVFISLLNVMIQELDNALDSVGCAWQLVATHAPSSLIMKMLKAGFGLEDELLWKLIAALRARLLRDVQERSRIHVPKGICLMGIKDETSTLPPGTVYFKSNGKGLAHGTRVAVGRCPCLHPGDIRVLTVYSQSNLISAFDHLENVIVFSSMGDRPDCQAMSGGDLDGDLYLAIWDPRLVPQWDVPPMDYQLQTQHKTHNPVHFNDFSDVQQFFGDYIQNDVLGLVSHAHLALADQSSEGVFDEKCMKLAQLHSVAVDFAKTGVPAKAERSLHPTQYPDFMEKSERRTYKSGKVLGTIYRTAIGETLQPCQGYGDPDRGYDERLVIHGHEHYVEEALVLMDAYCWDLYHVAQKFEVHDEGELLSGFSRKISQRAARRDNGEAMAKVREAVLYVRKKFAREFWRGLRAATEHLEHDHHVSEKKISVYALRKASAWYYCAYTWRWETFLPYLSFAWVAPDVMAKLKEYVAKNDQV